MLRTALGSMSRSPTCLVGQARNLARPFYLEILLALNWQLLGVGMAGASNAAVLQ